MNFFSGLPPPRAANKTDLKRSWRPLWAHMAPEAPRKPSGPDLVPSGPLRGHIFLDVCCFSEPHFSVVPSPVLLGFRFPARVCSLLDQGLEAFIFKVGTPRFLKPWLAAGGREAIRIS